MRIEPGEPSKPRKADPAARTSRSSPLPGEASGAVQVPLEELREAERRRRREREELLERLGREVEEGTYQRSAAAVAEKMVDSMVDHRQVLRRLEESEGD